MTSWPIRGMWIIAPVLAGPGGADAHPAGAVGVVLALAVPVELHLHPAVLVGEDLLARRGRRRRPSASPGPTASASSAPGGTAAPAGMQVKRLLIAELLRLARAVVHRCVWPRAGRPSARSSPSALKCSSSVNLWPLTKLAAVARPWIDQAGRGLLLHADARRSACCPRRSSGRRPAGRRRPGRRRRSAGRTRRGSRRVSSLSLLPTLSLW